MKYLEIVIDVMNKEMQAIKSLIEYVNEDYEIIIDEILNCKGKVIFLGVGKSGHIGKKLAATFASTGTPSFFVHGTESVHGDLGMIEKDDIVILISNSGNTMEVVNCIPYIKNIGAKTIAITSGKESKLGQGCDYALIYPKEVESDHLNLAPTSSSTMTLVLGDAIACAVSKLKNFTSSDFHKYHPGGSLGEKLKTVN